MFLNRKLRLVRGQDVTRLLNNRFCGSTTLPRTNVDAHFVLSLGAKVDNKPNIASVLFYITVDRGVKESLKESACFDLPPSEN